MDVQKLINELAEKEITLWCEGANLKYKAPKGAMTADLLSKIKSGKSEIIDFLNEHGNLQFVRNTKGRYEKFPLTDIQNSYVVGRNTMYELGGVACHGYIEMSFDKVLDIKRLEIAWNKVIQKHDMLRAIVSNSGYQIVQEAVPYVTIQCLDLRITEGNNETDKNDFRRRLANKQYELGKWPMCDLALTVENEKSIIHLSLDMLIADFVSTNIILHDLETFYENPDLIIVPTTLYRDVVLYQNQKRTIKTVERNVAEKYWSDKIPSMGEAPDLPLKDDYALDNAKFTQKKVFLNHDMWMSFVENARKFKVTPSILIMASFAEVLGLWSSNNKFCINTTILNRPDVTQDVNKIVGDFTDVNVTAIALDFSKNFIERARTIQNDLWVDLEHNAFSGVEVLRKMTKDRKKNIIIPVVYTSTVGMAADDDMTVKNPITYKISQTPQVYIDCQAAEENNGCTINWDVREGVFDDFIIEAMFESFKELLLSSCETLNNRFEEKQPVYLPSDMRSVREKINDTKESISPYMMMEGFAGSLEKYSNKTALITPNGEYTYSSLAKYVATVYDILKKEGVGKGDIVGVDISKGVWQIASVLGILFAEALYVPLDTNQPLKRKEKIVNSAGINLMLTEQENLVLSNNCKVLNVTEIKTLKDSFEIPAIEKDYDRPAYIIFTSGTTGEPKGVIITHRAAMNTICNINQKYNITERDVFFGLANLSFDLSVYDIFGCYQVGGTLVLPDSSSIKDPKQLTELLVVHGVTVWNSVPAQMQMVINYMENSKVNSNIELRVVLLSGDWIPVNLPKKIYEKFNKSRVVSLGGATEASIWSIYYDIQREDDFEKSIPYGYPLANQKFYVLNENLQSCPDYVVGSLYIAGVGLSAGYLNDEKLNQEKYKYLPETGEKIYKTGDIGCYTRDGIILFKGREAGDEQVKIHGHRVELAEIRSVLNEHPLVESSVVLAMGESAEDLHINAVVAPVKKKELTSIHITNAEKENLEKLEKYYEEEIDQDLFERWINKSEEVVTSDIFNTFRCYSIFDKNDTVYSLDEIVQKMQIPEKLHKLTKRWLRVLIKEKVIEEKEGGYQLIQQEKDFDSFKLWDEFYQIENKFGYSRELVDYLKQSSDLLPELIQGKEDPLNILFPKGEMDPALAAYHDNQINKMLNDIAKAEIDFLCREKNQNKKRTFRILEVGAGVGGTSLDVIPSLDGMEVEYYFTDLSTFFLNRAQDNFGKYDWVKYGIFDINKEFAIQGYDEFSFDLILCANVLHNSRNIHDVMENLKGLLTDNGSMVILEETRTSYILLTSMEFKDGLTGFTDERAENEQTFFTRNQWESVFASHKGEIVFEFPSNESKLDLSGQTIYVTRFVNELEPIRKHDVRMYLEEQVSPYMVPANILVIPEIPLTSNRKVDTKAVKNYFMGIEETNKKGGTELPQTDLEKRIADIWCKELNISNIGRNDSFYLVGGDSLLIAQVIGKMLEKIPEAEGWEWSALLTEMMQTPTIKGIAEKIEAFQKDTDYVIDPCLVQLKKSVKENSQSVAKVLFHAGTGTLTPYNALLSYIEKDSKENEAIIGFTFGDDADYISMETSQTFRLLGEKYGKILNKLGYSNYILIGHCVGGLIALETAQYLQKKNVQVSDVTLISSNIPKQKNQTILSQATDEIYRKTLQSSLDNEILLERIFAKLIGADAYKAGYQVDEERLQQYIEYIVDQGTGDITVEALCNTGGKFEDVAKEFRLLASKSVSERLNALYNIIERPNGELMEHQLKMLNILFRVFSQNFRCVSTYEPKPYYGNMRILCCEIQGGHFYPGFFAEDYETWKPYAKGNLTFDLIKGWHLDCITEPNLGENIKKMLDFNY